MVTGSAWAVLLRWSQRGIGLLSTYVLARLLSPNDFGIVAMASLSYGFLEMFSALGVGSALIRQPSVDKADCDTAWTLQLLQGLFIAFALCIGAPLAARFFGEPRLIPVVYALSVTAVLGGVENIGMILVRKDLDFAREYRFFVYQKMLVFTVTVPSALILRNYWALVAGMIAGSLSGAVLSYVMHPYRPRPSLARRAKFLGFALSIIPINIGRYLRSKVDTFVVGRTASAATLGGYNVAADLSETLAGELGPSLARALLPTYSKLVGDPRALTAAFLNVLAALALISVPIGLGLATLAPVFVDAVLGEKWLSIVPVLRWLAVLYILRPMTDMLSGSILIVVGRERLSSYFAWFQLLVLVPFVTVAGYYWGVEGVAKAATLVSLALLFSASYVLTMALPVTMPEVFLALWRPAAAGAVMVMLLTILPFHRIGGTWPHLLAASASGAFFFVVGSFALWRCSGRPQGPEGLLFRYVATLRPSF